MLPLDSTKCISPYRRCSPGRMLASLCAALFATLFLTTVGAAEKSAPTPMHHSDPSGKGEGKPMDYMDMHKSMMQGMKEMGVMKSSGDVDYDFALMMKKHHEGALHMAQVELEQGKDPELRRMAKKIISSQNKEIKQFDKWLAKRKPPAAQSPMSPKK